MDLARELKMVWNMSVTAMVIAVGPLWTVRYNLGKCFNKVEIRESIETLDHSIIKIGKDAYVILSSADSCRNTHIYILICRIITTQ